MSKRTQEGNGEESRPMMSLVSTSRAGSSTVPISTTPVNPVSFNANSHGLNLMAGAGSSLNICTGKLKTVETTEKFN